MKIKNLARFVGSILLVTQLSNFILSLPPIESKWTLQSVTQAFSTLPALNMFSWLFTAGLAVFMLMNNRFYLKTVLVTIAYYIFLNLIDFSHKVEMNGFLSTLIAMGGNIIFFALVLKHYLHKKNQPVIEFDGMGPWARLSKVTDTLVHVERLSEPPPHIESRLIDLEVDEGFVVKLKFEYQNGDEYIFRRVS